jgi:hypothetical protein
MPSPDRHGPDVPATPIKTPSRTRAVNSFATSRLGLRLRTRILQRLVLPIPVTCTKHCSAGKRTPRIAERDAVLPDRRERLSTDHIKDRCAGAYYPGLSDPSISCLQPRIDARSMAQYHGPAVPASPFCRDGGGRILRLIRTIFGSTRPCEDRRLLRRIFVCMVTASQLT